MSRRNKLGLAFSDELNKVSKRNGHFRRHSAPFSQWEENLIPNYRPPEEFETVSSWRLVSMSAVAIVVFFGLFLRLFHLQIVQGTENRERADFNRIQMKIIRAPRGVIYDRNGKVLAESNPAFRLVEPGSTSSGKLISRDEALELEAKNDPQAANIEVSTVRSYPFGPSVAHILGYVGQISAEDLKEPEYKNYHSGDLIGRSGIEKVYESVLKGIDGAEITEIDAAGHRLRTLKTVDPIPGQNVYLSIDADLQKKVYDSLQAGVTKVKSCCGAAVAETPKTGEILALASYPSYDDNAFTDSTRSKEVSSYFNDADSPLLDRAISGTYPPGSTFKITTALAGLSSGKINASTQFEDTGVMYLGPYSFANWYFTQYGKKEGPVDVVKALQRSNDIFFYQTGNLLGVDAMGKTAKSLGFGEKLGIDLPGEEAGLVPDNAWKEANTGQPWYPGDNLHMAIGQGFLLTTPLQILAETSFVAADGNLMLPHLAIKITSPQGNVEKVFSPITLAHNLFKESDLNLVKKGMAEVPQNGGTAWPFFSFSLPTAGKTGTAEYGDSKGRTHAWYTSYAPVDDPQIALTVLVEGAGEGSNDSAPVAKDIYTWYFSPDKSRLKNFDVIPIATESAKQLGE